MCGAYMEPCNTLSFFNIGFAQQECLESQNVLGPLSQKNMNLGKFMIVGKALYDWPTF
jgi:hypothetical protein